MKKIPFALYLLPLALLLGGCGIYGSYRRPTQLALSDSVRGATPAQSDTVTMGRIPWRRFFGDPHLRALIDTALVRNTDLRTAELNVEKANAGLLMAGLSFAPNLGFAPSMNREHSSLSGWSKENAYTLPITSSWEIDLSGRLLNGYRGAEASKRQAEDYLELTRANIIAAVANTYYSLQMLDRQLFVAHDAKRVMDETAQTMEVLMQAGRLTGAAVAQARAQAKLTQVTINDLESQIAAAENSMRLLLMQPGLVIERGDGEYPVPLEDKLKVGIPLQLLSARPDVRAKEEALKAAFYGTQSARGNFLPTLTLTASGTWLNKLGQVVVSPMAFVTDLAAGLFQPVFQKGRNIAQLKIAKAAQEQALLDYEKTLLSASHEVSNYLAEYLALSHDKVLRLEEIELRKEAEAQTLELMKLSSINYLEVLTAQSQRLNAELGGVIGEFKRTQALINLWKALGGGWNDETSEAGTDWDATPVMTYKKH